MVSEARGRLFRRKDGKYLLYIPVDLAEDSMFPIKCMHAYGVDVTLPKSHTEKNLNQMEKEVSKT